MGTETKVVVFPLLIQRPKGTSTGMGTETDIPIQIIPIAKVRKGHPLVWGQRARKCRSAEVKKRGREEVEKRGS